MITVTGATCLGCNTAESVCRNSYERTDLTCCPRCDHPELRTSVECQGCNASGPTRPTEAEAREAARDVRGFVRVLVAGPFGDVPTDLCPECAALHGKRDARGRLIPAV